MRKKYKLIRDMTFNNLAGEKNKDLPSLRVLPKGSVYPEVFFKELDLIARGMYFRAKKEKKNFVILHAEKVQRIFIVDRDVVRYK